MITVERSVLIGYSAQAMFDLVEDIEHYPDFLPWCIRTHVERPHPEKTIATLYIQYLGINLQFTTENEKKYPHEMNLHLLTGPFKTLEGRWRFIALSEEASKIELRLSYEFSNRLLDKMLGPVFSQIAATFVETFVKRAKGVYGDTRVR